MNGKPNEQTQFSSQFNECLCWTKNFHAFIRWVSFQLHTDTMNFFWWWETSKSFIKHKQTLFLLINFVLMESFIRKIIDKGNILHSSHFILSAAFLCSRNAAIIAGLAAVEGFCLECDSGISKLKKGSPYKYVYCAYNIQKRL